MAGLWQESQTRQQHARHRKRRVRPPFLNPLKSYGGQPGRCRATTANERRFGLDDDEEQVHSGTFFWELKQDRQFPRSENNPTLQRDLHNKHKISYEKMIVKIALDRK